MQEEDKPEKQAVGDHNELLVVNASEQEHEDSLEQDVHEESSEEEEEEDAEENEDFSDEERLRQQVHQYLMQQPTEEKEKEEQEQQHQEDLWSVSPQEDDIQLQNHAVWDWGEEVSPSNRGTAQVEVDVIGDGGVVKRILRAGRPPCAVRNCKVALHYVGRLAECGTVFDCAHAWPTQENKTLPLIVHLGKGEVLAGLDEALLTMQKGEHAVVTIKPEYGFGATGCPPRVPPGAVLQYSVELLYIDMLSFQQGIKQGAGSGESLAVRLERAAREREVGNDHYRRKAYRKAATGYNRAMAIFDGLIEENMQESELDQWHKAVLPLHTNLAATYMALRDYNKARHHAKQALAIDPRSPKGLFWLAKANEALHDYEAAREAILRLDQNETTRRWLNRLQEAERSADKQSIFAGIFQKK